MTRPYRPVVSAMAQPMIMVVVTLPLLSGWRPMASQALADGVAFADTRADTCDQCEAGADARSRRE